MKYLFFLFFVLGVYNFTIGQIQNRERLDKRWRTDTTKHSVPLNEFIALMPRDGFQVITSPKFITNSEAANILFEHEPVIVVEVGGVAKAYPLNILTYHEIANDYIGDIPIIATFCPLCNAGIVFDRRIMVDGKEVIANFGVSGMLRKSDMVMWDDVTESWWQQIIGEAIVGKMTGVKLKVLPSKILSVKEFFNAYPDGKIMSRETGLSAEKMYGQNQYESYDSLGRQGSRFFQDKIDSRLPAMERIVDISSLGETKIYPYSTIKKLGVINDSLNVKKVALFYKSGQISVLDQKDLKASKNVGTVTVFNRKLNGNVYTFKKVDDTFIDVQTESIWTISGKCIKGKLKGNQLKGEIYGNHFAFAWFAFYPDTKIYSED